MAIYNKLVDVPKNVSIKKSGKYRYVYYIEAHYQTKSGNWSHKDKAIGKLNEEDETTMFPNDAYFELFKLPHPREQQFKCVINTGHTQFLNLRARSLGLTALLREIFPKTYQQMLQACFYMVCEGNVMMYIDDFYESSDPVYNRQLSEKHLNDLYETITKEKIWTFFEKWIAKHQQSGDTIAYDVTSLSTYSENLEFAQRGYNRDGELLPQINCGLLYSQTKSLPLCYELYDGSIPDKVYLKCMLDLATEMKLENVIFVMDRGFLTEENLKCLVNYPMIQFILAFPNHQKYYASLLRSEATHIRQREHYSPDLKCYGLKKAITLEGMDLFAHLYLNTQKAHDEEILFSQTLKTKEGILQASLGKKKRKTTSTYFNVDIENEVLKAYQRDEAAIQASWDILGMFGILTNVPQLGWEEVLTIYRQRDRIEKNYDNMKNNLDFSRLRTHTDQTTQGKFFIGFLAQILQADIINHLGTSESKPVASTKKMIKELQKIRKVIYSDNVRLAAPLSKKQKNILKLFDIQYEDFIKELT